MFGMKIQRRNNPEATAGSVSADKIQEILNVVDDICQGNFESRITNIATEDGAERTLCLKINEMIDRADEIGRAHV